MRIWDAFTKRLRRWSKQPLDHYVYRIEGLHGDHRWHIHAFLRDSDFPPAVVQYLWDWGEVYDAPYDYKRVLEEQGYRCLARYFTKEVPEVGRHPWGCSRALSSHLPPPQITQSKTGVLRLPPGAILLPVEGRNQPQIGDWGVFSYARYLLPKK